MNRLPLPLRTFAASDVRRCNRLNVSGVVPLPLDGSTLFIACVSEPLETSPVPEGAMAVDVKVPAGDMHLIFPRALLHVLLRTRLGPAPPDALQPNELLLHAERLFDGILRMHEEKNGVRPQPMLTAPRPKNTVSFRAYAEGGGIFPLRASLNDDLDALCALFAQVCRRAPPRNFLLEVRILADRRVMSRRTIKHLQAGSVVLCSPGSDPIHAPLAIYGDDWVIPLRADGHRAQVTAPPQRVLHQEASLSDDHPMTDIPVPVQFVLGRLNVPAERLLQLSNGFIFELDKPLSDAAKTVDVVVNHRTIARGEAVRVGDGYGVLINEVY